jgi:hypothetical protein
VQDAITDLQPADVLPANSAPGIASGQRPPLFVPRYGFFAVSPLASHHWDMEHQLDADFFCTRVINGTAVFRRNILEANQIFPDQLRRWLSHPVPAGMKRVRVRVRQEDDGVTYRYTLIDRETTIWNFNPNNFTRIEAAYTRTMRQKSLIDTLFPGGRFSPGGLFNVGGNALIRAMEAATDFLTQASGLAEGGVAAGGDLRGDIRAGLLGSIPTTNYQITARFWGHPEKPYSFLESQAMGWVNGAYTQLSSAGGAPGGLGPVQIATWEDAMTKDDAGRFIEIRRTLEGSVLSGIQDLILQRRQQQRQRDLGPVQGPRLVEPRPILNDPVRGTYIGACVAAALRQPNDPWGQPQDPPDVQEFQNFRTPSANQPRLPTISRP